MVPVPKYLVYFISMQKAFPISHAFLPRFFLLAGNSNNKLIIIKLLALATEIPNHFENLIMGSCVNRGFQLQLHILEPMVLTEVKIIVWRPIMDKLTLSYFILLPANNLKTIYFPQLLSLLFIAITNQLY